MQVVAAEAQRREPADRQPDRGDRATVLVVEDDVDVRDALTVSLAIDGYEAVGAANGHEALALLRAGLNADVILLDLSMPVMDGWQFRAAQLGDEHLAAIPTIVVSATYDPTAAARRLHASAALRKPVTPDRLAEMVGRYAPIH